MTERYDREARRMEMREDLTRVLGQTNQALVLALEAAVDRVPLGHDRRTIWYRRKRAETRPRLAGVRTAATALIAKLDGLDGFGEREIEEWANAHQRRLSLARLRRDLVATAEAAAFHVGWPKTLSPPLRVDRGKRGPAPELDRVNVGATVARVLRAHGHRLAVSRSGLFARILTIILEGLDLKPPQEMFRLVQRSLNREAIIAKLSKLTASLKTGK